MCVSPFVFCLCVNSNGVKCCSLHPSLPFSVRPCHFFCGCCFCLCCPPAAKPSILSGGAHPRPSSYTSMVAPSPDPTISALTPGSTGGGKRGGRAAGRKSRGPGRKRSVDDEDYEDDAYEEGRCVVLFDRVAILVGAFCQGAQRGDCTSWISLVKSCPFLLRTKGRQRAPREERVQLLSGTVVVLVVEEATGRQKGCGISV